MCGLLFSLQNDAMLWRCDSGHIFALIIDHCIMKGLFSRPRKSIKRSMYYTLPRTASRLQSVCIKLILKSLEPNLNRPHCGFNMLEEGGKNDRWGRGTALNASAMLVWTWSKVLSPHREDDKLMTFGEYKVQVGVVVATHNNKGRLRQ